MSYRDRNKGTGQRRNPHQSGIDEVLEVVTRTERKVNALLRRSDTELDMEFQHMADFTALNAKVSKMTDLVGSIKAMNDGLKAERDAAVAELEAVKAADSVDQAAVDAAEAKLAEVTAVLEALTAVVNNTGGSIGGASPTE